MLTPVGSDRPPLLSLALEEPAVGRFVSTMEYLGHRKDRAAMMGTFVASVAGYPAHIPAASIPDLQRYLPPQRRATSKQFRNLLACEGWDPAELRLELVAAGFEGVEAILIEGHELRLNTPRPYDVVSAHALGAGSSIPVGWKRFALPEKADDASPDIAAGERNSVLSLVEQLRDDCQALGLSMPAFPLVILDWRCGEDDDLRADLAGLGFEVVVEVGDEYAGLDQTEDPLGPQTGRPMLLDQMPFAQDGSPPAPRFLRTVGGRHEFVTARISLPGARAYAIATPMVDRDAATLTGPRAQARALELTKLAARIRPSDAATRLRVADFHTTDDRPWEAAAYLLSAFQATQMACFPRGGS
jgi:hypothetical protein